MGCPLSEPCFYGSPRPGKASMTNLLPVPKRSQVSLQRLSSPATQPAKRSVVTSYRRHIASWHTFFDSKYGGFADAPKFPRPVVLNFLLHTYAASPDSPDGKHALEMTLFTLRKMAEGGIHDQLGGGFHRYSVDDDRCIDGALAARMDVRPAGRRLGVHRISDRSTTQYCRARRWPVFAGHPHSLRIRSIHRQILGRVGRH